MDPVEISEIIMSIVNRAQESMRTMASQNMQQMTTTASPYVKQMTDTASQNVKQMTDRASNSMFPQKKYDQTSLDSSNNNYNILVGGGRKRKQITRRSLFGGKINKSIREFYMTNQVHKRSRKRY